METAHRLPQHLKRSLARGRGTDLSVHTREHLDAVAAQRRTLVAHRPTYRDMRGCDSSFAAAVRNCNQDPE